MNSNHLSSIRFLSLNKLSQFLTSPTSEEIIFNESDIIIDENKSECVNEHEGFENNNNDEEENNNDDDNDDNDDDSEYYDEDDDYDDYDEFSEEFESIEVNNDDQEAKEVNELLDLEVKHEIVDAIEQVSSIDIENSNDVVSNISVQNIIETNEEPLVGGLDIAVNQSIEINLRNLDNKDNGTKNISVQNMSNNISTTIDNSDQSTIDEFILRENNQIEIRENIALIEPYEDLSVESSKDFKKDICIKEFKNEIID